MKIRFLLLFALAGLFAACQKDDSDPTPPEETENTKANQWVYGQMEKNYYWATSLADRSKTNLNLAPEAYLASILSSEDRFSYIEESSTTRASSGYKTGHGIQYVAWVYPSGAYVLQVTSVTPDSPAQSAGIKRSDLITKVNGQNITASNWQTLLDQGELLLDITDRDGRNPREIKVAAASFYNTPVLLDSVYTVNGRKVGYLAYARFESAREDVNDIDLENAFRRLKQAGVEELILDLRYNGGGFGALFQKMSAMIAPRSDVANALILGYTTLRKEDTKMHETIRFQLTDRELEELNLDLDRLIVLANSSSASASELTMHCLREYIPVIHYGVTTVGKYVGSTPVSGESSGIHWKLYAITTRFYDRRFLGDPGYPAGLTPDYRIYDSGSTNNGGEFIKGQLGEIEPENDYDPVLYKVITDLGGTRSAGEPTTREAESPPMRMLVPEVRGGMIMW